MKLTKKQIEAQTMCDHEKWNTSIKNGKDMSGVMAYCTGCKYHADESCGITHAERTDGAYCGKAYLRFIHNVPNAN